MGMSDLFAAFGAVGGYFLGKWLFDDDVAIVIVAVASAPRMVRAALRASSVAFSPRYSRQDTHAVLPDSNTRQLPTRNRIALWSRLYADSECSHTQRFRMSTVGVFWMFRTQRPSATMW